MSDDAVRRALANLARSGDSAPGNDDPASTGTEQGTYREIIERATAAVQDLDAAAQFVDDGGLEGLERAVARAERSVSACAEDGRRALAVFREFREAADGTHANDASGGPGEHGPPGDHFRPGHGTSLGGGDIGPSE